VSQNGHAHSHDDHDHAPRIPPDNPGALDLKEREARAAGRNPSPRVGFTARESKQARRLVVIVVIIGLFFIVEYAGAVASRSNALEADALHLLMDVAALGMSLVAMRVAVLAPTARFTFGMRRAEPVAALFNAALVLAATVEIIRNGVNELRVGGTPEAGIMLVVASAALVVNGVSAWLLHGALHHHDIGHDEGAKGHDHKGHDHAGHDHSGHDHAKKEEGQGHALNLRGAWLHLIGDILGSLAALVAAIVIRCGGPPQVDPIASFLVATILILGAIRLVRDATLVLLEAAPVHLPVETVRGVILAFPGVAEVHELHVWTLGGGHDAITTHVRATTHESTFGPSLAAKLRASFSTEYVTVQVEAVDEECRPPKK
jgi:cobalt-zinc-cadmium efflux system protein